MQYIKLQKYKFECQIIISFFIFQIWFWKPEKCFEYSLILRCSSDLSIKCYSNTIDSNLCLALTNKSIQEVATLRAPPISIGGHTFMSTGRSFCPVGVINRGLIRPAVLSHVIVLIQANPGSCATGHWKGT